MRLARTALAWILLSALGCPAATLPYDEHADAHADLQSALQAAKQSDRKVLVVFGANWCPACLGFEKNLHEDRQAPYSNNYLIVHIDVGRFDRNLDLAQAYGNPIRKGIPAAVVLDADNTLLYAGPASHLSAPYGKLLPEVWRFRFVGAGIAGLSLIFLPGLARRLSL